MLEAKNIVDVILLPKRKYKLRTKPELNQIGVWKNVFALENDS